MRTILLLLAVGSPVWAEVPSRIVRPDTANFNPPSTSFANGAGVVFGNGEIRPTSSASGFQLEEYSFGNPFTAFQSPYEGFANDVLQNGTTFPVAGTVDSVFSQLYPAGFGTNTGITATRSQIENSDGSAGPRVAFRYKFLLFGGDPSDTSSDPPIINIFNSLDDEAADAMFTEQDRALALEQIQILREALSFDPLNRDLQSALLDVFYDLAVAEMLPVSRIQFRTARRRLGLDSSSTEFIIDDEIADHVLLVDLTKKALELYADLFSFTMEGVEPNDFASSAGGAPFGYFVFQNQVPLRNQVPTAFAPMDDSVVVNVIAPGESNTFSGYRDYRNLLNILGQHILFQTELARLRGMRQAAGDVEMARMSLTDTQEAAQLACFLENMFAEVDFDDPSLDMTGVRGARVLARNALNEALGIRRFLDGTSNILGLDPNFLLLVPTQEENGVPLETYDILVDDLVQNLTGGIAGGPLGIALARLTSARVEYDAFRGTVDEVTAELNGLEDDFADRFAEITGFDVNPAPGQPVWDGVSGASGSELAAADANIDALVARNSSLGLITEQLVMEMQLAEEAVTLAQQIRTTITGAEADYLSATSGAWIEIHVWAGAAAGAQALADSAYAVSGLDGASTLLSGGGTAALAIGTGIANALVQTTAATRTSMREQELEEAAIARETTIELADQPLTVQQARLEAAGLYREALSNVIEIQDNFAALDQGIADKVTLLLEVQRLQESLEGDLASLGEAYAADPIFFIRAESALLSANNAFARAQRSVFITARALEYKWQERFAISEGNLAFDISSIFSARNAEELNRVVEQMRQFNTDREQLLPGTERRTTVVSMRDHLITPNPANQDLSIEISDDGLRYDASTREVVDAVTLFRRSLTSFQISAPTAGGNSGLLRIPFDTTRLEGLDNLFTGATYTELLDGSISTSEGSYLNKIDGIAVNIVTENGETDPNMISVSGVNGRLFYGGNTFFRTRIAVCPNREEGSGFDATRDFPGELIAAPYRFFQGDPGTGNFEIRNEQEVDIVMAESGLQADTNAAFRAVLTDANEAGGFRENGLNELSVAATRWALEINQGQVSIDEIVDIEILILHRFIERPEIDCP